jgi:hypothetical protein
MVHAVRFRAEPAALGQGEVSAGRAGVAGEHASRSERRFLRFLKMARRGLVAYAPDHCCRAQLGYPTLARTGLRAGKFNRHSHVSRR